MRADGPLAVPPPMDSRSDSPPARPKDLTSPTSLFIAAYHVALAVGLPLYLWHFTPSAGLVLCAVVLLFVTEIGIGAAYHRFYAHRAYRLNRFVEGALLGLATLAFQGTALRWAFEHRLHHTHVDGERDPYSIRRGFWYAHMLWLFDRALPIERHRVRDLLANPLVVFQDRYYPLLAFGSNTLVWLLAGWAFGDFLGAFVLVWWTRLFVSHHLTWFVNSLAHCWGARTFSKEQSAVDNFVLAFLTVGEGYHNYHHTFASDYRNGVRWYHFDPVKWTVWTLSKLGLARDLRRVDAVKIQERLLKEDRKLLVGTLESRAEPALSDLGRHIEALAETIQEKLSRLSVLKARLTDLGRERAKCRVLRERIREARRELRRLRQSLRADWRAWHRLCALVLEAPAFP